MVDVLEQIRRQHGFPRTIRVDRGSEFISKDLDLWAYRRSVILDLSRPGKPTDNAYIESLNGKFRTEGLNVHWFVRREQSAFTRFEVCVRWMSAAGSGWQSGTEEVSAS